MDQTNAASGVEPVDPFTGLQASPRTSINQVGDLMRVKLNLNGDADFTDTGEMDDTRAYNVVNELSTRDTDSNASVNYTLVHDAAGQLTDDGQSYKYVWDAFGRLMTVKNQSNAVVAEYRYNGLGYRISWHYDADVDNDVDSNDPTYYFCYDDRWRVVATLRGSDSDPKELFFHHNAGANGLGGSSYIDLTVLRDKDSANAWTASGSGTFGARDYYCQNWRADISVLVSTSGVPVEWVKYSAYGVPSSYALGDFDKDGEIKAGDGTAYTAAVLSGTNPGNPDVNFDGTQDATDDSLFAASTTTGGKGVLSRAVTGNRVGYAGYQKDPAAGIDHVRHRVYSGTLARWLSRDRAGYRDGLSGYAYCRSSPIVRKDASGLCSKVACTGNQEGVDLIATCQNQLASCQTTDPVVQDLQQRIQQCQQNRTPGYVAPSITCGAVPGGGAGGGYDCANHMIYIDPKLDNNRNRCISLAHELSHALDDCENGGNCAIDIHIPGDPDDNGSVRSCWSDACTEIRAYP
jgi:RHS repeat-associated protein